MSHITKVVTSIKNLATVEAALRFLDVKNVERNTDFRMWGSQSLKAPIVIRQKNYDIGFSLEESGVVAKADSVAWRELFDNPKISACAAKRPHNEATFANVLKQACNIVTAINIIPENHSYVLSEPNSDGNIAIRIIA